MKSMLPETMQGSQEVAVPDNAAPADLLQVIANAVAKHPTMDVDKMERLLAMHERIVERNAKVAFESALSRIQARVPRIKQTGVILAKDKSIRSRYAPLPDIDKIVRPMLADEGFALSFDARETPSGKIELICKLSHKDGHSEVKAVPLPIDKNEYRTAIQDHASTISFGKRILVKNHLNIIEEYEDNDGQSLEPITDDQVRDLEIAIKDANGDLPGFLRFMGVDSLKDLRRKDLKKAATAIEEKKKRGRR